MAMQQHAGVKRNAFQMNVNQENMCEPQLEIEEEPKCTGYRFRYECEGGAHGNINGANSTKSKKTFPTVKLKNWKGAATISVQCITNEDKYQRHTHDLLGKECSNGVCVMELKANNQDHTAVFSGLSIKHCTRKLAKQIMTSRNEESILAKKMQNTLVTHGESAADHKFVLTDEEKKRAQDEAVATCNNLELSVVRLLFQANLIVNGNVVQKLEAISCPIYDAKAPGAAALRICRMDKSSGSCVGNEEVFLLCDKVQKDDISVSFQEYAPDGSIMWEAYAKFGPQDVHRQYAIVFRTPAYRHTEITHPVEVKVKLKRMQRGEESNEVPFKYHPEQQDEDRINQKKRKTISRFLNHTPGPTASGSVGVMPASAESNPHGGFVGNGGQGYQQGQGYQRAQGQSQPLHAPLVTMVLPTQSKHPLKVHPPGPVVSQGQGHHQLQGQGGISHQPQQIVAPPSQVMYHMGGIMPASTVSNVPIATMCDIPVTTMGNISQFVASPGSATSPLTYMDSSSPGYRNVDQSPARLISPGPPEQFYDPVLQRASQNPGFDMNKFSLQAQTFQSHLTGRGVGSPVPQKTGSGTPYRSHGSSQSHTGTALDLSRPRPLDLSKLRTDNAPEEVPLVSDDIDLLTQQVKETRLTDTEDIQTVSSEFDLTQQVVKLGDRLFRALQDYARTADVSYLLLVQRHLLAQQDDNGDNILHLAVMHNKHDIVKNVLRVISTLPQCDVINQPNDLQYTPLHYAAISRDVLSIELLLLHDASVTALDHHGNTPIHLATKHKAPQCLRIMLAYEMQKNNGRCPSVNIINYDGVSALHIAIRLGHLECVRAIVEVGKAKINIPDGCSGKTPLHCAVEDDQLALVGYLVNEAKIEVNASDYNGATPLHYAVTQQLIGCTSILMTAGADPDAEIIEQIDSSAYGSDDEQSHEKLSTKERLKLKEGKEKEGDDDEEEVGKEDDDEDSMSGVVSMTAWSMANGNTQLEGILRGEASTEPVLTLESAQLQQYIRGGPPHGDTDTSQLYTVPPGTRVKELSEMDSMSRKQMSMLLDPMYSGHDWRALAVQLDMAQLIEAFAVMDSPTKALLSNLEATDGDLDMLQSALDRIQRSDAINLVQEVHARKQTTQIVHGKSQFVPGPMDIGQVESGLGSMSLQS